MENGTVEAFGWGSRVFCFWDCFCDIIRSNKLSNLGWWGYFCLLCYGVFCDVRNPSNLSNRLVKAGLGPSITFGTQSITLYLHKVCDVALHHFTLLCRRLLCGQHHFTSLNFTLEGHIVWSTLCGHLKHLNITLFWRALCGKPFTAPIEHILSIVWFF